MSSSQQTNPAAQLDPRRWKALALLCGAFFMVILDAAIVTVALPSIETELDFSAQGLQWVVSAYALTFAGLLLLGGRAADLLGRVGDATGAARAYERAIALTANAVERAELERRLGALR